MKLRLLAPLASAALSLLLTVSGGAQAAIIKCTGADGKTVFSDKPCGDGQASTVIKSAPPSPSAPAVRPASASAAGANPAAGSASSGNTQAMEARRQRLEAAMTPECRDLRDRLMKLAVGEATEEQIKASMTQFETRCKPAMDRAMALENAREQAERDVAQKRNECSAKRTLYDERRARMSSLSAPERAATEQLGAELSRDCR